MNIEKFRTIERYSVRTKNGCGFTGIIANSSDAAEKAALDAGLEQGEFSVESMKVLDTDSIVSMYEIWEDDGRPTGIMFNCVAHAIAHCKEHNRGWKPLYVLK